MGSSKGPDQALIALQKAQAQLLREKERDAKLEKGARDRNIRNSRNARGRTLLKAKGAGAGSFGPSRVTGSPL